MSDMVALRQLNLEYTKVASCLDGWMNGDLVPLPYSFAAGWTCLDACLGDVWRPWMALKLQQHSPST
jgi:hypothetical protein